MILYVGVLYEHTHSQTHIGCYKTHKPNTDSSHDCQMLPLTPEGEFDMTIRHRFTPISVGSKSHQRGRESQSQEMKRATLNGCKCITLHVLQLSVCRGGIWVITMCVSLRQSSLGSLSAIFPVSKINIWASVLPESLTFHSRALLYIQEVSDTESLILLCSSATEAAGLSLFQSVSVQRL